MLQVVEPGEALPGHMVVEVRGAPATSLETTVADTGTVAPGLVRSWSVLGPRA